MVQNKQLIVIGGATAVGKTAKAIEVAKAHKTEIISADSRQIYAEMCIGTACPTAAELAEVPHHFIQNVSIHDHFSAGDYEKEAIALLKSLFEKYDTLVMVGGTGLYIRAVCEGLDAFPEIPNTVRQAVQTLFETEGITALQAQIADKDPIYAQTADMQNPMRLMRALEVIQHTEQPFSSFRIGEKKDRFFIPTYQHITLPRPELYARINHRVTQMMQAGLLQEAENLYPHRHLKALQTVGYSELFDYIDGKTNLAKAIELIQQHSRNYAKRQITWFSKW